MRNLTPDTTCGGDHRLPRVPPLQRENSETNQLPLNARLPGPTLSMLDYRDRPYRDALLAIIPFGAHEPLSGWVEIYQRKPATAIQLIFQAAPVQ